MRKPSRRITVYMDCYSWYSTLYGWHEAQQVAAQMEAYTQETAPQVPAGCLPVQASLATGRLWSPLQVVDMMEVQEHSDHRQVEDKHAFHTDLDCRLSNQEVIGGSWDRVERVLSCSRGTSRVLDLKIICGVVVDLLCGIEEVQGLFLSSFLRANIPRSSIA